MQQHVRGLLARDRLQVHEDFSLAARLLANDMDPVGFGIPQRPTSHRYRARDRDWFFQRQGFWRIDIAYHIDLIGFGKRYDVAGFDIGVGLFFAAHRVVEPQAEEAAAFVACARAVVAEPGPRSADYVNSLARFVRRTFCISQQLK